MAGFGTWNLKWFFFHFLLGFIQTAFSWWLQAPKLNLDGRECRFFPTNVRGHSNRASLRVVFVRWNSESPAGFRWFQHVKMVWERKIGGMILESTLHCAQLVPHFFDGKALAQLHRSWDLKGPNKSQSRMIFVVPKASLLRMPEVRTWLRISWENQ